MTAYVQSFEEELEKIAFNFAKMAPQGAGMLAGGALGLASTSKQGPGESAGGFATRALINTGLGAGMGFAGGKGVQALGFKNMKQIGKASKKGLRNMGILEKPTGVQRVKETLGDVMEGLLDNQKAVIGGLGLAGAATLLHGPTRQKVLNAFQGISLDQINAFRQQAPQVFDEFVNGIKNGNLSAETINKVKSGLGSVGATVSKAWDDLVGAPVQSAGKMTGRNADAAKAQRAEEMAQGGVTNSQMVDAQAAKQKSSDLDDALFGTSPAKPTPVSANAKGPGTQSGAPTTPVGQNVTQVNTPGPVAGGPVPAVGTTTPVGNANVQQAFNQEMQALDEQLKVLDNQIGTYMQRPQNLTVQVPQGAPAPQPVQAASQTRQAAPQPVQAVASQTRQAAPQPVQAAPRSQRRQVIDPNARREVTQELPPARVPRSSGDEFDVNEVSDFLPTGQVRSRRAVAPTRQDNFDVSDVSDFMTTGSVARRQSTRAQNTKARQATDDMFDDGEVTRVSGRRLFGRPASSAQMDDANKARAQSLRESGMLTGQPATFANGRTADSFIDELSAIERRLTRGGENSVRSQISNAEARVGASRQRLKEARQGGNQSEIMAARKELTQSQRQLSSLLEDTASDVLQGDPRVGIVNNAITQGDASRERQIASVLEDLTQREAQRSTPEIANEPFMQRTLKSHAEKFVDSPRYKEIGRAIRARQRRLQGQIDQVSSARPVGPRSQSARRQTRSDTDLESTLDLGTRRGARTPDPTGEFTSTKTRFTRVPTSELAGTRTMTTTRGGGSDRVRRILTSLQKSDVLDEAQKRALRPSNNPDRDQRRLYAYVTAKQKGRRMSGADLEKISHQNKTKQLLKLILDRR